MLRILAIFAVLAVASVASADDSKSPTLDVCLLPSNMAKAIMTQRQNGGSLPELMRKIPTLDMKPALEDLAKKLAVAAYGVPVQSNEKFQDAAIIEFENQTYLECSKGTR